MSAVEVADVADVVAGVCLVVGALLTLVAAIGILRFPDVLTRMHSATTAESTRPLSATSEEIGSGSVGGSAALATVAPSSVMPPAKSVPQRARL